MKYILYGIVFASFISCNTKGEKEGKLSVQQSDEIFVSDRAPKLLVSACYVCHNPNSSSHDEMLAPPLAGIKQRYLKESEGRVDFIDRMSSFVSNPNEESALMKGPIKKFGLMPKTALSNEEINEIVTYIYAHEMPPPTWFKAHEKAIRSK